MKTIDEAIGWLELLYGPLHGVAELEVAAAEQRLGRRLPAALRAYYLRTAATEALHARHNRLVPLDELALDDHLVVYEENQGVVVWGISAERLDEPDPPVEQGVDEGDGLEWYPEFESISVFAAAQGAFQAVCGGLEHVEHGGGGDVSRLGPADVSSSLSAWRVGRAVVVATDGDFFGAAAATQSDLDAVLRRLR